MKKTMNKALILALALILLCITISIALVSCDFNKKEFIAVDDKGNEYKSGNTYTMPNGLQFTSDVEAAANKSITVKVTVLPENASNKNLNWAISWKNSSSEWATGKTMSNYIGMATTDNSATITCKNAFGEQVILTVWPEDNPTIRKTCTIDYQASIDIKYEFFYANDTLGIKPTKFSERTIAWGEMECPNVVAHNPEVKLINFASHNADYWNVKASPIYGVGTIFHEIELRDCELTRMSFSLISIYANKYNVTPKDFADIYPLTIRDDNTFEITYAEMRIFIASTLNGVNVYDRNATDLLIRESFTNCALNLPVNIGVAGNQYIGKITGVCVGIDETTCKYFSVTDISLSDTAIVFK